MTRAEVERLRREARTIFAHVDAADRAIEEARKTDGDHWETGEIALELEAPDGAEIEIRLDVHGSAAENAQDRYERAGELEEELERRRETQGPLADAPTHPVAYLALDRLRDEAAPIRRVAADLDADLETLRRAVEELETAGYLERGSGRAALTPSGEDLARHLDTDEGRRHLLRKVPDLLRVARRINRGGPDYARLTAEELDLDLERTRHLYAALRAHDLAETYDGSIIKGRERKLKPKDETHRKHTYYVTTRRADLLLRDMETG